MNEPSPRLAEASDMQLVTTRFASLAPLPVADGGGAQFPQRRHWRAVAKQAWEWHSRQGGL